ncbi:bifunctional aspartate kinase/homoserine dehydrogenase I [Flavobacterium oreochromis]|uniref:bifunctional aspartate kinase/homoserine dehydrogenase I n=1 Tax=Flavobacterium oreochromis TaxID=2906078 RepID=UPI00385CE9D4
MKVLKFGGTSVGSAQSILQSINIINRSNKKQIVVVSAFSEITDLLEDSIKKALKKELSYIENINIIRQKHEKVIVELKINDEDLIFFLNEKILEVKNLLNGIYLLGELSPKNKDKILSIGELLSSNIIYHKLHKYNNSCKLKDSRELIKTDSNFGKANVDFELSNFLIQYYFEKNESKITILPGFISQDKDKNTTTLGRGGSDYTASIIAAALNVAQLEIWTDVSGLYSCHPKIVTNAFPITNISYKEAMELSHFGAKVIYAPTIQPVQIKQIPLLIKNTFEPEAIGTLIHDKNIHSKQVIKGISHIENISLITLEGSGLIGISGNANRLFKAIAKENINIIFITQASSEHSICIGVMENEALLVKKLIDTEFSNEIIQSKVKPTSVENDLSIIAIVGEGMKNHQGISGKIFSTLGNNNVNIRAIAQGSSERNISLVINNNDIVKALNCLHERFFEEQKKELNLFVIGTGNVGSKLIEQISNQINYLKENLRMNLRLIGISNTQFMYFNLDGIDFKNWNTELKKGDQSNLNEFLDKIKNLNLINSIFIDNTASTLVANQYEKLLSKNIAVVTCNKIACSSNFSSYQILKNISKKYNVPFLYETNVGAGLPIIDTLKNIVISGDVVTTIQAVLSGSLNFIFNNYDGKKSFASVVKLAMQEGYTEPDPKIDLSGIDVMRKIVILIRESGYSFELNEIKNQSFLPEDCIKTSSVNDFLVKLEENEVYFKELFNRAKTSNSRLKYVATFKNGKANVGLEFIPNNHPFYHLEGKDNIVLFYTHRYNNQPLIIKGAGAGADVTASGIFADIMRVGNTF